MRVLALNAGSSSLKFRLGEPDKPALFEGEAEGFGTPAAKLTIQDNGGTLISRGTPASLSEAARAVLDFAARQTSGPQAIGHRFVHGGPHLLAHCRIDAQVRAQLKSASAFAPLHNPPALAVLALTDTAFPQLPQVACLDTAFHARMPEVARRFPLPANCLPDGVRRYGFHGLSCESTLHQLGTPPARLVIAHLGGGASVTAVREGISIDTSMGLTPDGGVMMETRPGDLDPGLMIYLLRQGETADSLEQLFNRQSGIAGVSGHGGDLRDVRAAADDDAGLALEMFTLSVAKMIAAMATVLDGTDVLVFTGGIGEHDETARNAIIAKLGGLKSFKTRVLPAREEEVILRHCTRLLTGKV